MAQLIDLNADMGESFGDWTMGNDEALLNVVTSANIACGFHAGDPDVMAKTMARAHENGVGIGAHPGFPDLQGFGRRRMSITPNTLANMVRYQLGAARAMAAAQGLKVRHFKLHGALSNMASEDKDIARTCYEAALSVDPDIILVVLAATPMQEVAQELRARWAAEVFADRAYNDDATLVDRSIDGAVIHDPELASSRILAMLEEGAIISESGKRIPTPIDTICTHGDTENALEIARQLRKKLKSAGFTLAPMEGTGKAG
ncbi:MULTISPECIES: LamB/YcsF family protein [Halocynthiibacter]|uniref:5-oxoprolinase subunit A n=1 Tax=Halocynthiibacter halioticoli TaxID=2986804 RepID=A0AAE3LRX7_9RHOB|nr:MULTISPECIES: 5-oxoprolinase subunit PxpA [Halocynthiibacter]MCV6825118.1 LamB/YcsF family protein [Halocynthiibacter halioticoli]MCW4058119.1 LamB/YcsF family protein [Halocynthiibacter sp. SDUM655004]